jgi:hypothetical protein
LSFKIIFTQKYQISIFGKYLNLANFENVFVLKLNFQFKSNLLKRYCKENFYFPCAVQSFLAQILLGSPSFFPYTEPAQPPPAFLAQQLGPPGPSGVILDLLLSNEAAIAVGWSHRTERCRHPSSHRADSASSPSAAPSGSPPLGAVSRREKCFPIEVHQTDANHHLTVSLSSSPLLPRPYKRE